VSPESLDVGLVVVPLASAGTGTAGGGRWPLPVPLPFMAEEDVDLRAILQFANYLRVSHALLRSRRMASRTRAEEHGCTSFLLFRRLSHVNPETSCYETLQDNRKA